MASSTISRTCARSRLASRGIRAALAPEAAAPTAQRSYYTPTPLQLDFLTPSWQTPRAPTASSRQLRSATPSPYFQTRHLSSTTCRAAKAITNPRKDDDGSEITITITPRASTRLEAMAKQDDNPSLALRVSVESGGCHGFQYLMSLVSAKDIDAAEDTVFENEEGEGYRAKVVLDEPSLDLLKGSSIDYTMELIGSQFKVTGIPGASSSCGCGTSFDVAA